MAGVQADEWSFYHLASDQRPCIYSVMFRSRWDGDSDHFDRCLGTDADAIVSSNTFPSIPLIDPETLEFEINVDGLVSSGGLGGPAILPLSLAKMAQMTRAFPDKSFSGIGGISDFSQALSYLLLGCGTVQVCTAAMLDQAVGPNVIKRLLAGLDAFLERHAADGWSGVESFRGLRRDRIVAQSEIRRPDAAGYHSGYEVAEGYAPPQVDQVAAGL